MYRISGAFGKIRSATMLPSLQKDGFFWVRWIGWHKCNDLYHISRPRGSEFHLILVTVNGCGQLRIRDQTYQLTPGTIAVIPKGVPNAYRTPKDGLWEFYWLHPDGNACNSFLDMVAESGVYVKKVEDVHQFGKKMENLMSLCREISSDSALQISLQLSALLHEIALRLQQQPGTKSLSDRVIAYLERHYQESVQLEQVAAEMFVSVSQMIRVFKREVGCTPHQYLLQYRLTMASLLLKFSDSRVDEIAAQTGFSSSSHFISLFRKQHGLTPVQYREQENRLELPDTELLSGGKEV